MPELETQVGGKTLRLESGTIARQADAAVLATWGDTKVLVTVVCQPTAQELDYFPLRVDFEERFYAGGKIPGGFFKREGRPSDDAVLAARLIDRPIRPLFPDGYREEVHIVATVLSGERDAPPDVVGLIGASAALLISPAPFAGPVGAVRLGMDGDEIVPHPTEKMDIVVAGTRSTVTMVEGHLREVPDERVVEAFALAHKLIQELIEFQERFAALHTVTKRAPAPPPPEATAVRELSLIHI